jgi:hypothetical protein
MGETELARAGRPRHLRRKSPGGGLAGPAGVSAAAARRRAPIAHGATRLGGNPCPRRCSSPKKWVRRSIAPPASIRSATPWALAFVREESRTGAGRRATLLGRRRARARARGPLPASRGSRSGRFAAQGTKTRDGRGAAPPAEGDGYPARRPRLAGEGTRGSHDGTKVPARARRRASRSSRSAPLPRASRRESASAMFFRYWGDPALSSGGSTSSTSRSTSTRRATRPRSFP